MRVANGSTCKFDKHSDKRLARASISRTEYGASHPGASPKNQRRQDHSSVPHLGCQPRRAPLERLRRRREHLVPVLEQHVRVPLQEEAPVLAVERLVAAEEAGRVRPVVVAPRVVRPGVAPLIAVDRLRSLAQLLQHVPVVTLWGEDRQSC